MTHPNKFESLELLEAWKSKHAEVTKLWATLEAGIGADPDGPLMHTLWGLSSAYTNTLAQLLGDRLGWMTWFQDENDMGARGMEAGNGPQLSPITTIEHLYALIEESRERATA